MHNINLKNYDELDKMKIFDVYDDDKDIHFLFKNLKKRQNFLVGS